MQTSNQTRQLERLQRLLAARDGKPGFKSNVIEIRRRIAALESTDAPSQVEVQSGVQA